MTGKDFEYCGKRLSDFNLIMAKPDEEDTFGLARNIVKGVMNPFKNSPLHFGTTYDDVLNFNIFCIKNPCNKTEPEKISIEELRSLAAWLTSSKKPKLLKVTGNTGRVFEYNGLFDDFNIYDQGGLYGITMHFTCDSQYGFERQTFNIVPITQSYRQDSVLDSFIISDLDISGGILAFDDARNEKYIEKNIFCNSDELEEYCYPVVTIYPNNNSKSFMIENLLDGGYMQLYITKQCSKITLDCKYRRILIDDKVADFSSTGLSVIQKSDYNSVYNYINKIYWLKLKPGSNNIRFTGDATFVLECRSPMKVGGFIDV